MRNPDIGILNFDNRRFATSEPNDIYWYSERYHFDAVLYFEDSVQYRERFYDVCDDLSVNPIYGLQLRIRTSAYVNRWLDIFVCPIERDNTDVTDWLSEKARNGGVTIDDILSMREQVRIGLTLSGENVDLESIYGICKFIIRPDFVFLRYDVIKSDYFDDFSDGAFFFMREHGILIIPLRNCQDKEHWRYLFEDMEETAVKARQEFLKMFVWEG